MTARTRLHTRAQNPRVRTTTSSPYTTPPDYPVVSLHEAIWSGTRRDTLYATANYHARQGNGLIASRLRKVAAELAVA